jgi:hypothetical protein
MLTTYKDKKGRDWHKKGPGMVSHTHTPKQTALINAKGFGSEYDASRNKKDLKRSISHRIKHF